jgi:hypothetical protein
LVVIGDGGLVDSESVDGVVKSGVYDVSEVADVVDIPSELGVTIGSELVDSGTVDFSESEPVTSKLVVTSGSELVDSETVDVSESVSVSSELVVIRLLADSNSVVVSEFEPVSGAEVNDTVLEIVVADDSVLTGSAGVEAIVEVDGAGVVCLLLVN